MRAAIWVAGIVCAVAAVAAAWMVASSLMLIYIAALPEPIASPWTVWWFYASHGPNAWTKAYLFAAALLPTLFVVLCVFIVTRYRRAHAAPSMAVATGPRRVKCGPAASSNQGHRSDAGP